jgi:cytosolic 5'-nucleotidase 3
MLHIKDKATFERKKQAMQRAGAHSLHIVADFDQTLTKAFVNGQKAHSGIAQIRENGYLSPEYAKAAFALHDKYRPYEHDESLTTEQRCKYMVEWWTQHLALKIQSGMNKSVIDDIIAKKLIHGREGLQAFLHTTHANNIPVLIFSAGLGDLIEEYLKAENALYSNVHIISNFYAYDQDGKVTGYKSKIIHTFNKGEVAVKDTPYAQMIKAKRNVLLLGDSLGDIDMVAGIEHDNVIRIGFLNGRKELLHQFEKQYDVVILEDTGMDEVNKLLQEIIGTHKNS